MSSLPPLQKQLQRCGALPPEQRSEVGRGWEEKITLCIHSQQKVCCLWHLETPPSGFFKQAFYNKNVLRSFSQVSGPLSKQTRIAQSAV